MNKIVHNHKAVEHFLFSNVAKGKHIHYLSQDSYQAKDEKKGRMPVLNLIVLLSSTIRVSTDKDLAKEAYAELNNRVKKAHYRGFCGLVRRVLSVFFTRFSFESTAKSKALVVLEEKINAITVQPKRSEKAPISNLKKNEIPSFTLPIENDTTAFTKFAPKEKEKEIAVPEAKKHAIFTPKVKAELEAYAYAKNIQEDDIRFFKEFDSYFKVIAKSCNKEIDPSYFEYADNSFLKFVLCWREIELLYTEKNLPEIKKLEDRIPRFFTPDHGDLIEKLEGSKFQALLKANSSLLNDIKGCFEEFFTYKLTELKEKQSDAGVEKILAIVEQKKAEIQKLSQVAEYKQLAWYWNEMEALYNENNLEILSDMRELFPEEFKKRHLELIEGLFSK